MEDFSGSYKKVENYLQKKKLLPHKFVEAHSEYLFLSDSIADHFFELAKALPKAIMSSLPKKEQTACRKAFVKMANNAGAL